MPYFGAPIPQSIIGTVALFFRSLGDFVEPAKPILEGFKTR